jgi:ribose/xylose/arabinose/galactoside ABC-type transport system permease subunit
VKITCFMIVGLLGSFSAILQVIRTNAFFPGIATGWNLNAIVAAVIGGADLFGGAGNMIGLVLGGFTLIVIENGMVMMGINTTLSWLIYGAILLSFVTVSEYLEKLTIKTTYAK